jgi:hypothetical protein
MVYSVKRVPKRIRSMLKAGLKPVKGVNADRFLSELVGSDPENQTKH